MTGITATVFLFILGVAAMFGTVLVAIVAMNMLRALYEIEKHKEEWND